MEVLDGLHLAADERGVERRVVEADGLPAGDGVEQLGQVAELAVADLVGGDDGDDRRRLLHGGDALRGALDDVREVEVRVGGGAGGGVALVEDDLRDLDVVDRRRRLGSSAARLGGGEAPARERERGGGGRGEAGHGTHGAPPCWALMKSTRSLTASVGLEVPSGRSEPMPTAWSCCTATPCETR